MIAASPKLLTISDSDFTLPPGYKFSFLTDAGRLISARRVHIRDTDQCSFSLDKMAIKC